jgi:hypothetical protein
MFKLKRIGYVSILLIATIIGALSAPALSAQTEKVAQAKSTPKETEKSRAETRDVMAMVTKTYELTYIKASELLRLAKFYVMQSTGTESTLTVEINKSDIPNFEALIKKYDVEKKSIRLKVYAIVASRAGVPGAVPVSDKTKTSAGKGATISGIKDAIEDKELKKVLDELKALWNFQTYEIDGPSYLSIRENSGSNNFKLVTDRYLNLLISNLSIRGEESDQRIISIEQLKLAGKLNFNDEVYFDTHDVVMKERGYLVAGVSGFGSATKAIILVLSAEI